MECSAVGVRSSLFQFILAYTVYFYLLAAGPGLITLENSLTVYHVLVLLAWAAVYPFPYQTLSHCDDASGLTLTCARHVVILEPQLDLATELRMIGRVHRIGQTRARPTSTACVSMALSSARWRASGRLARCPPISWSRVVRLCMARGALIELEGTAGASVPCVSRERVCTRSCSSLAIVLACALVLFPPPKKLVQQATATDRCTGLQ